MAAELLKTVRALKSLLKRPFSLGSNFGAVPEEKSAPRCAPMGDQHRPNRVRAGLTIWTRGGAEQTAVARFDLDPRGRRNAYSSNSHKSARARNSCNTSAATRAPPMGRKITHEHANG